MEYAPVKKYDGLLEAVIVDAKVTSFYIFSFIF